jgi:hypothetical protein
MGENCGKLFFASTLGEELPTKWKELGKETLDKFERRKMVRRKS